MTAGEALLLCWLTGFTPGVVFCLRLEGAVRQFRLYGVQAGWRKANPCPGLTFGRESAAVGIQVFAAPLPQPQGRGVYLNESGAIWAAAPAYDEDMRTGFLPRSRIANPFQPGEANPPIDTPQRKMAGSGDMARHASAPGLGQKSTDPRFRRGRCWPSLQTPREACTRVPACLHVPTPLWWQMCFTCVQAVTYYTRMSVEAQTVV